MPSGPTQPLPREAGSWWVHRVPLMSPTVPGGRHKGCQHDMWHSLPCYRLLGLFPLITNSLALTFSLIFLHERGRWPSSRFRQQCPRPQSGCAAGDSGFLWPWESPAGPCRVAAHPRPWQCDEGWEDRRPLVHATVGMLSQGLAPGRRGHTPLGGPGGPSLQGVAPTATLCSSPASCSALGSRFLGPFHTDKQTLSVPVMGSLDRTAPCQA